MYKKMHIYIYLTEIMKAAKKVLSFNEKLRGAVA